MRVLLPYGKEKSVSLEIQERNFCFLADRMEAPALREPSEEIRNALKNPIGTPPLSKIVHPKDRVVVLADDVTRPTPQKILLPVLLDELNAVGVPDRNIEIVVALGTHRMMSEGEIRERFGEETVDRVPVINSDWRNPESLVDLGETESGTPISLNKRVHEANFVIGVGNIVPHCYSGWGGGGKIIQPGVCGEETTARTHFMAGRFRPISEVAGTLDNAVRKEIDAVALRSGLSFIVNTVLNSREEVSRIVAGHPIQAFGEGVKAARKIYCPRVPSYADVVVVSSYPADIDYWQAHKSACYAHALVKPRGTIVLITPCPERISPMHPTVRERGTIGYDENLEAALKGEVEDLIAMGALLIHAQILERAEVICYSDGLTESDKEALGFRPADMLQEAIEMAIKSQGKNAKIGVLRCGEIAPTVDAKAHTL